MFFLNTVHFIGFLKRKLDQIVKLHNIKLSQDERLLGRNWCLEMTNQHINGV